VSRRTTRRVAAVATALAGALALAGCGTTDALVGLHPAPAEETSSAPLDGEGATAIAARLLDGARASATTKGEDGEKARSEFLTGDALTLANASAERGAAAGEEEADELTTGAEPTVVAQSRGRGWPRAILATTLDETTSTQYLHVMVSETPEAPFKIASSVPMLGGAELPAIGAERMGAPFVDVTEGDALVMAPDEAFDAYAAAIAYPKPKESDAVSTEDSFAQALQTSAKAQTKALKKLGELKQKHDPDLEDAVAFRLADGGVVAFGLMKRTDTITVDKDAKELVLPGEYADVVGEKKVTKSVSMNSLEPLILVVPTEGKVRAIGASELLVSGKGS
jgi:hypothetical protein